MYSDKTIKIISSNNTFSFFDEERKSFNCYSIKINIKSIIEKNIFIMDNPLIVSSTFSDNIVLENIFINLLICKNFIVPTDTLFDITKTKFFVNNEITFINFLNIYEENNTLVIDNSESSSSCDSISMYNYNGNLKINNKVSLYVFDHKVGVIGSVSSIILKNTTLENKYIDLKNIGFIEVYDFSVKKGEISSVKIPKNIFKKYEFFSFLGGLWDKHYVFPGIIVGEEQSDCASIKFSYNSIVFSITSYENNDYMIINFEHYNSLVGHNDWTGEYTWNENTSFRMFAYNIIDSNWY